MNKLHNNMKNDVYGTKSFLSSAEIRFDHNDSSVINCFNSLLQIYGLMNAI